jgi:hypothetical protein
MMETEVLMVGDINKQLSHLKKINHFMEFEGIVWFLRFGNQFNEATRLWGK